MINEEELVKELYNKAKNNRDHYIFHSFNVTKSEETDEIVKIFKKNKYIDDVEKIGKNLYYFHVNDNVFYYFEELNYEKLGDSF